MLPFPVLATLFAAGADAAGTNTRVLYMHDARYQASLRGSAGCPLPLGDE
jgi:hypothetical protein